MEKQSWNHSDLKSEFGENFSLSDVILNLEGRFKGQKKVICRVTVNGLDLSESDEKTFSQCPASEIQTLEIELSGVADLVTATIQSSVEYARLLVHQAVTTSQSMRVGDLYEAHIGFKKLIEGVDSLIQAEDLIGRVLADEGRDVSRVWENQRQFLKLLSEILESYKKSDFILTADQLEYDLSNTLDQTVKTLGDLIGRTSGRSPEGEAAGSLG